MLPVLGSLFHRPRCQSDLELMIRPCYQMGQLPFCGPVQEKRNLTCTGPPEAPEHNVFSKWFPSKEGQHLSRVLGIMGLPFDAAHSRYLWPATGSSANSTEAFNWPTAGTRSNEWR